MYWVFDKVCMFDKLEIYKSCKMPRCGFLDSLANKSKELVLLVIYRINGDYLMLILFSFSVFGFINCSKIHVFVLWGILGNTTVWFHLKNDLSNQSWDFSVNVPLEHVLHKYGLNAFLLQVLTLLSSQVESLSFWFVFFTMWGLWGHVPGF